MEKVYASYCVWKIFFCTAVYPLSSVSGNNLNSASFFFGKLSAEFFEDFFPITFMNPNDFILIHIVYYCDVLMTFLVAGLINAYPYYIIMNTGWYIRLMPFMCSVKTVSYCSPVDIVIHANICFRHSACHPCYLIIEFRRKSAFSICPWNIFIKCTVFRT